MTDSNDDTTETGPHSESQTDEHETRTRFERLTERLTSRRGFVGGAAKLGGGLSLLSVASNGASAQGETDTRDRPSVNESTRTDADRNHGITQAPALPGAQEISSADRVYTADQSSNTVSVIDPSGNGNQGEVLGTIPLGERRLDGTLGPVDTNQVNVHGLGFSRDGDALDAISVTSNAAQVIDTSTNEVEETTYVGRAPHEGFISPDGEGVWVAVRGEDYVAVVSREDGAVTDRIETAPGASKVVFSPDGRLAFVNHLRTTELVVVKVANRKIIERIDIPKKAGGSADLAISPDGEEVWLGHPLNGYTTVVDAREFDVKASFETGPRTNHPNFVTKHDGAFAYVTVGGENHTEVFRRADSYDGHPEHVETIENNGVAPHGIWPSPDNTHVYVALQKSDGVDVINTELNEVIETLDVGQDPQALVYVAGTDPAGDGRKNLTEQGLGKRIENITVDTSRIDAESPAGLASVRELAALDEVDVTVRGFPPNRTFTVYASDGTESEAILDLTTNDEGTVGEALAFVKFFENGYDRVFVRNAASADQSTEHTAPSPSRSSGSKNRATAVAYYQVDFVVGRPIHDLRSDEGYYTPDRLIRFAHGDTDAGITRRSDGEFLTRGTQAECIESQDISVANGTATTTFTIADGCEPMLLTLASYRKPGPGWSPKSEADQEFVAARTHSFGPGTHTLTVDLPTVEDPT